MAEIQNSQTRRLRSAQAQIESTALPRIDLPFYDVIRVLDQLRQRIAGLASGAAEPVLRNILEYTSMKVTRTKTRTPKSK